MVKALTQIARRGLAHSGVCALAVVAILAGCSAPKPAEPLRVGTVNWPGLEFAFLAQEKGFFRKHGVDVKLLEFGALADARRAYERGQVDGMFSTVIEVLQADGQDGRAPKITMVSDFSNGADVILAAPGAQSIRALKGKRVGLELGTLNEYLLARALEKAGMEFTDVKMVGLAQTQMQRAYADHEVDALVSFPPYSLPLLQDGKMHTVFSSAEIPGEVVSVLFFDDSVLKNRPQHVAAFLRAFGEAQSYAKAHPEEAYRFMAAKEHVTVDEFKAAISEGIKLVELSEQAQFFKTAGTLDVAVNGSRKALRATGQLRNSAAQTDVIARTSPL